MGAVAHDAVVVADGAAPSKDIKLVGLVQDAYRHCETVGAQGGGSMCWSPLASLHDGPSVLVSDGIDTEFFVRAHRDRRSAEGADRASAVHGVSCRFSRVRGGNDSSGMKQCPDA